MKFGNRDSERFWISVIVRFAFGFFFLIAALNIFTYYDTKDPPPDEAQMSVTFLTKSVTSFAADLKTPYEYTWLNFKWTGWPLEVNPETNAPVAVDLGIHAVEYFLMAMPFIFLLLAILLLTGLWYRLALRLSAFYLVILGLGKYVTGDSATTAQDFIYAAFICIGLFLSAKEPAEQISSPDI